MQPTTDEVKAYRREKTRRWREQNPERSKELTRKSATKSRAKKIAALGIEAVRVEHRVASKKSYQQRKASDPDFARKVRERAAAYREKSRERLREQERARYAASPAMAEKKAALRQKYPERYAEYSRRSWEKNIATRLVSLARTRALKHGVAFDLTDEWAKTRWTGICEVTGLPFALGRKTGAAQALSPSIDRIVPSLGYVKDNCRFVIWAFNRFKGADNDETVLKVARAIVANSPQQ